jgi:hypothetical protein
MEVRRFDTLARQVGAAETRRGLLGRFGGTALGALVASGLIGDDTQARKKGKKKKGKKCKGGTKKCGKTCIPTTNCCSAADCNAAACETCQKGTCVASASACCPACPGGQQCLSNGSCATLCREQEECTSGGCLGSCVIGDEGPYCTGLIDSCEEIQQCASTAECPTGQHCQLTPCGPGGTGEHRCFPLCNP